LFCRDVLKRLGSLLHRADDVQKGHAGLLATTLLLAGCSPAGAPTIPMFGAYFPSWLACALIGILGAVVVRLVFIKAGIDDVLPWRLPIYVCVAASIGFLVSILGFGR
jgi:hypothetical protein